MVRRRHPEEVGVSRVNRIQFPGGNDVDVVKNPATETLGENAGDIPLLNFKNLLGDFRAQEVFRGAVPRPSAQVISVVRRVAGRIVVGGDARSVIEGVDKEMRFAVHL